MSIEADKLFCSEFVYWVDFISGAPVKVLGTDGVSYCVEGLAPAARLGTASRQDLLKIYEGQQVKAVREGGAHD